MTTSTSMNKQTSQPLERKKVSTPILDTPENSLEEQRIGWFDQDEFQGFDATTGSINFDSDKAIQPSVVSEMFEGSDEWISIKPSNIAEKVVNTTSTAINIIGSTAVDTKNAVFDLGKEIFKTSAPENNLDKKENPKIAEEQKSLKEYSAGEQQKETVEAEITSIRRKLDNLAQVAPRQQEIADLTGLQALLSGKSQLVNEAGEVRIDLQESVAQKREEIIQAQQAKQKPLTSTSKKGGQGQILSNDDNRSGETHQTAQTATG